ncbi:metalloregulator ArsR/SmtB family transcription factor [Streptomyces lydicus]|uniref:metalloregulator ArsR/SmtB family transcription factor n=1 Tax=Streptomyces lydicus TaxID=47763 RepID=UPI001F50DEF7|nr:metalloregulator ArsR/SmtB family transcription factor [Streptomyces lydicus]
MATETTAEVSETGPMYADRRNNTVLAERFGQTVRALGLDIVPGDPATPAGSSDIGNLSQLLPVIHPYVQIAERGTPGLSEAMREAAATAYAHDRTEIAATGLARVVLDLLTEPGFLSAVRAEFAAAEAVFNSPHLVVKNEPGLPPVLHYSVDAPAVGVTLARSRMPALTDPRRVRLCRLIARESMTTLDLAARLTMTAPQVSRHLRALRDLGLVRTERSGRFVLYRLDLAAVERLGQDVVTGLQH